MLFIHARQKPKFGQAGIIPGHPLTPIYYCLFNENGGRKVFTNKGDPLDFVGTYNFWEGDYVDLTNTGRIISNSPVPISLGTSNYTIFACMASSSSGSFNSVVTFNGFDPQWYFNASGYLDIYDSSASGSGTISCNDGKFHTVAWIRNGTGANEVDLYIDGIFDTNMTHSDSINAITALRIGYSSAGEYMNGKIKLFYLYNRALSGGEIVSLTANPYQWIYDKSERLIRSVWAVTGGGSTYNMSMSESSSITDSLSNIATLIGSMAESDSITDSLTSLAIFIRNITESVAISDIFNGLADFIGSIGESATINDAPSSLIDFVGTINEISNTSDNLSSIANLFVSIAESNSIQDTLAAIGTFTHTINESATIEDAFRVIAAIIEFVKTFGEVSLTSKVRGSVSRTSDISGDVEKDNTIRGEVKNAD